MQIKARQERKQTSKSEEARSRISRATTTSRWNHTKIFSDFSDEDTENSDAEYMDTNTISGRQGKASSQYKSKASSFRLAVIFIFIIDYVFFSLPIQVVL